MNAAVSGDGSALGKWFDVEKNFLFDDLLTDTDIKRSYGALSRGNQGVLHFHGLDSKERLARFHGLASGDENGGHLSGDG